MYFWRSTRGPVDLAFTDRYGGASAVPYDELNLALNGGDEPAIVARNHQLLREDFAPDDRWVDLEQVHGADVAVVTGAGPDAGPGAGPGEVPRADAAVTDRARVTLMVRAADCVPVLLADADAGVIGAVHSGRPGLARRVAPAAVAAMRDLGARRIEAWIGPHVCGRCYEVPEELREEVAAVVPQARATTSWGTPALDLGAGVRAQLEAGGVHVHDVSACTRESTGLYSYRRDGERAGRLAGVVRIAAGAPR